MINCMILLQCCSALRYYEKVLNEVFCIPGERSVCVEQQIDDKTKKVEVILSSYHSAVEFR